MALHQSSYATYSTPSLSKQACTRRSYRTLEDLDTFVPNLLIQLQCFPNPPYILRIEDLASLSIDRLELDLFENHRSNVSQNPALLNHFKNLLSLVSTGFV